MQENLVYYSSFKCFHGILDLSKSVSTNNIKKNFQNVQNETFRINHSASDHSIKSCSGKTLALVQDDLNANNFYNPGQKN